MKKAVRKFYSRKVIPFHSMEGSRYPGGADRRYYKSYLIDCALSAVTTLGAVSAVAFLITL